MVLCKARAVGSGGVTASSNLGVTPVAHSHPQTTHTRRPEEVCEQGIERCFRCHSVPGADSVSQATQLLPHQISLSCSEETSSFVSLQAAGS